MGQIGLCAPILLASGAAGLFVCGASDPPGCAADDPVVTPVNARAGNKEPNRDCCHENGGNRPHVVETGEEDTVFDPAFIDLMEASDTKGSLKIVRIKGVGHAPQFEAPQRVIEAIKDHLSAAHIP